MAIETGLMDMLKLKFDEQPYRNKKKTKVLNPLPVKKEFRIEELEYLDKSLLSLPRENQFITHDTQDESSVQLPTITSPWNVTSPPLAPRFGNHITSKLSELRGNSSI